MQLLDQTPTQLFRRIISHLRRWRAARQAKHPFITPLYLHIPNYAAPIHREVSANGVRVYSLCGDCGSRLRASATLCDECAQKRTRSARPY